MMNDDEVELSVCCGFTVLPVRLLGGEETHNDRR
jgi:hypothetical protein